MKTSLNPCFSGICAASKVKHFALTCSNQSLNPCFSGICAARQHIATNNVL